MEYLRSKASSITVGCQRNSQKRRCARCLPVFFTPSCKTQPLTLDRRTTNVTERRRMSVKDDGCYRKAADVTDGDGGYRKTTGGGTGGGTTGGGTTIAIVVIILCCGGGGGLQRDMPFDLRSPSPCFGHPRHDRLASVYHGMGTMPPPPPPPPHPTQRVGTQITDSFCDLSFRQFRRHAFKNNHID